MSFGRHPGSDATIETFANDAEGSHSRLPHPAEVRLRSGLPLASRKVVRFTIPGAKRHAALAWRRAPRRRKFLKFEDYHGWYDPVLLNANSPHPPERLVPWNPRAFRTRRHSAFDL